jgi:hypothetical protein
MSYSLCAKLPPKIVGIREKALVSLLSIQTRHCKKRRLPVFFLIARRPFTIEPLAIPHSVKHCYFSAETSVGSTTIHHQLIPSSTSGDYCHILRD